MKKSALKFTKRVLTCVLAVLVLITAIPPVTFAAPTPDFSDPSAVTAKWMAHLMGRGTNLGNTFEMDLQPRDYASVKTAVDDFIAAGFTHIRIPFNWCGRDAFTATRVDANGNVDFADPDVITFKNLVDYITKTVNPARKAAGQKQIVVIVNTHHEEWAMNNLIGSTQYTTNMTRLENVWKGISALFKDSPDSLMFELFNEPHLGMDDGAAAKSSVVDMTKRFYNVIRNYTYNGAKPHQYRKIMFGGVNWNSTYGLWSTFANATDLPGGGTDKYIMGTYHFYNPISGVNTAFTEVVNNFQNKYDIPVVMGEFGVNHQGNITDAVKSYYRTAADLAVAKNFAVTVWDDNGWFQVYDRVTRTWNALKNEALGNGSVPTPPASTEPITSVIPGTVQAEDYSGMFGFQTEACTDVGGGYNVGYTDANDWLDFSVNVQTAGTYTVEFRLAGVNPTGTLQLQKAGAVLATVTPPNTAGWQTWQTVTATANLTAGAQTLRLYSTGSEFNINWIKFTQNVAQVATPTFTPAAGTYTTAQNVAIACSTAGSTIRYTTDGSTPTATSPVYTAPINVAATTTIKALATATGMTTSPVATAAYTINVTPTYPIPGTIEAENYSAMLGFQTQACTDVGGGLNVGYTDVGDYMDYSVNVATAGTYTVELRMAGLNPTGTLQLQKAGAVLATITPPNTGAWQTWQTVTATVNLTAGVQTLRLYSNGSAFNINWFKFTNATPVVTNLITNGDFTNGVTDWAFNINGTGAATNSVVAGQNVTAITNVGTQFYNVQLPSKNFTLTAGQTYTLSFKAKSTVNRTIKGVVENSAVYTKYLFNDINITPTLTTYTYTFTMAATDNAAHLVFGLGNVNAAVAAHQVTIDDVVLTQN